MNAFEHYNTESTKSMFKETFRKVLDDFNAFFSISVKLGLVICPHNHFEMVKQIAPPILAQVDHCKFTNATPIKSMGIASGEIMMDGSCASYRGYGIHGFEKELDCTWFIITIVVYPSQIQILFGEGPVMDHSTYAFKCLEDAGVSAADMVIIG